VTARASRAAACLLVALFSCSAPPGPSRPEPVPYRSASPSLSVTLTRARPADPLRVAYPRGTLVVRGFPAGPAGASGIDEIDAQDGRLNVRGHGAVAGGLSYDPGPGGLLVVDGAAYRGALAVTLSGGTLRLVHQVDLEDYLLGVVGSELPASSPPAALEAQAIASRSYALAGVRAGVELEDDESAQVYRGAGAESEAVRQAVRATRGRVLLRGTRVLKAYFHSTCGGFRAGASEVFPDPPEPALEGNRCGFCDGTRHSTWRLEVPAAELARLLQPLGVPSEVRELRVLDEHPSGRARTLVAVVPGGERRLPAIDFRRCLGTHRLRSTWITAIDRQGDVFAIRGRGFGHGVGLCQIGAIEQARRGRDARSILEWYYPGATVEELW